MIVSHFNYKIFSFKANYLNDYFNHSSVCPLLSLFIYLKRFLNICTNNIYFIFFFLKNNFSLLTVGFCLTNRFISNSLQIKRHTDIYVTVFSFLPELYWGFFWCILHHRVVSMEKWVGSFEMWLITVGLSDILQYELLRGGFPPITAWRSFRLTKLRALIRVFPWCMQRLLFVCSVHERSFSTFNGCTPLMFLTHECERREKMCHWSFCIF